jgi:hypothetical protein
MTKLTFVDNVGQNRPKGITSLNLPPMTVFTYADSKYLALSWEDGFTRLNAWNLTEDRSAWFDKSDRDHETAVVTHSNITITIND